MPQASPEQQRRAARGGEQRRAHELGQVVHRGELLGLHLQVELEARVGGLEHDVPVGRLELLDPADEHGERPAPRLEQRGVQGRVARRAGHLREGQVGGGQRRQDAREQHARGAREAIDEGDEAPQLLLQAAKKGALEGPRRQVRFQVELGELGGESTIVRPREDVLRDRRGAPVGPDEEHLLLEAHAAHAPLERAALQQELEGAQLLEDVSQEAPYVFFVAGASDDVLTHAAQDNGGRSDGQAGEGSFRP